jgi:hypothetical protein
MIASLCARLIFLLFQLTVKGLGLDEKFSIPTQPLTGPDELQSIVAVNNALSNLCGSQTSTRKGGWLGRMARGMAPVDPLWLLPEVTNKNSWAA